MTNKQLEAINLLIDFTYYNMETLMFSEVDEYEEDEILDAIKTLESMNKEDTNKLNAKDIQVIDNILEYAQMIGYVDFEKHDELDDEAEMEKETALDIEGIRRKLKGEEFGV